MASSFHSSFLVLLSSVLIYIVNAYPNGPPTSACTSLTPTGHQADPQGSLPPYTITLDTNTYSPGKTISVTLAGVDGATFKGFFLQVRRKDEFLDTTEALGTFVDPPAGTKLETCHNNPDSGWVHSSPDDKTTVTINWVAPNTPEGDIAFKATVVQGPATVYWQGLLSNIINYDGPTGIPQTTAGAISTTSQPITTLLLAAIMGLAIVLLLQ